MAQISCPLPDPATAAHDPNGNLSSVHLRVDSRSKCNGDDCICLGVELDEVEVSWREEEFCRCFPSEGFSWSGVDLHGDLVELCLGVKAEVFSFWEVLAEQAVGVFVDAALPRAVGMSEVDLDSCLLFEPLVAGHETRATSRVTWAEG